MNKNKIKKASVLIILIILAMSTMATSINSQEICKNIGKEIEIKDGNLINKNNYINNDPFFSDPWWDSDWTYRKMITIDYNEIN